MHPPAATAWRRNVTRKPTLKTIAEISGLAVATVSRALNDAPDIRADTKVLVRRIAAEVGYVPNRAGVRLRTGRTNVISLVMSTEHSMMNHTAQLIWSVAEELRHTPYHLIISHTEEAAHLWRAKKFSWSSADWELVSDQYIIGKHYEYDDGVKVDGTYYLYEEGIVYTFSGPLEEASGKWKAAGTFPFKQCDDIGIYYEDGVFHMFGEHGDFPHGPDGTSLAHFSSTTGLGDWKLVNAKAVDPNPDGGH
ncbi:MAG: LacI family DNA-binding transcriptional regulator, partial [Maritimibacter sp.]